MKNLRLLILCSGAAAFATGVLLACSSDDTIVSQPDAALDGATESSTPDSPVGEAGDAGSDVVVLVDAGFDEYVAKQAEAFCKSIGRCCFGNANLADDAGVDGGAFAKSYCLELARANGFEGSLTGVAVDGGGSAYLLDPAKAADCVAKLEAVSCNLTRADFAALRKTCFEAVQGTKTSGQTCKVSADCAQGTFCNPKTDGGTCEALRSVDAGCDISTNESIAAEACSWRASGDTNRYCETFDWVNQTDIDPNDWKCKTARPNGERCNDSLWCADGICELNDTDDSGSPDYRCRSPVNQFPPGSDACKLFVK